MIKKYVRKSLERKNRKWDSHLELEQLWKYTKKDDNI